MVSALVCTRDRTESLVRAVCSLLANREDSFELLVLDQSADASTEQALKAFQHDRRLRYVRSRAVGKSAALNEGLSLATGDIVVCTDDDCEAQAGWIREMAAVMDAHPQAAITFCNVTTNAYDHSVGYVPAFVRGSDRVLTSLDDARNGLGLGAGMALRRDMIRTLGGFDEAFGPGSHFGSGDDWDISIRVLLRGWEVYETAQVSICHHGFRSFAEGRTHAARDWVAIGALCAKPIRARYLTGIPLAVSLFGQRALWPPIRDLLRLRRPCGWMRVSGFVRGFRQGLRTPFDRETMLFRPDKEVNGASRHQG